MLFTPNYPVSYKGKFYRSGQSFEIDQADASEMSRHGIVFPLQEPPEVDEEIDELTELPQEAPEQEPEAAKQGGRQRAKR